MVGWNRHTERPRKENHVLTIPAKTVYIDPAVYDLPKCRARLERVLPFVQCNDIREYDAEAREVVHGIGRRRHGKDEFGDDAVLVFTPWEEDRKGFYYHWRDEAGAHGGHCQPALELNLVNGCVFRCAYCGFGRAIEFSLDVERLVDGLDDVFAKYPDQRLYKYSNLTDLPPFEPELDAIPPMVERFARESDRYLMLFTKSDNVDFLRDLDHRGHTIISWSVSCDTSSRLIDQRAATMEERINAMSAMQQCGYHVRARLSPVVPIRDWRREYTELFEMLFERANPDIITMELLGWMDIDDVTAIIDRELIDPDALGQAEESREKLAQYRWGPFTQETHEEVYQFCMETVKRLSPRTPISVCHGTPATWKALGGEMRMTPENYLCNCGPMSTPGGQLYEERWGGVAQSLKPTHNE
jgi:spore photoproduct lyase